MSARDTTAGSVWAPDGGFRAAQRVSMEAIVVGSLTLLGFAIRLSLLHQSLFGDELATFWDVTTHSFFGVVRTVHTNAEITPPLYFVLAKLATYLDVSPEMLRLPSLIAGTATIPLVLRAGYPNRGQAGRRGCFCAGRVEPLLDLLLHRSTGLPGHDRSPRRFYAWHC